MPGTQVTYLMLDYLGWLTQQVVALAEVVRCRGVKEVIELSHFPN